MLGIEVMPGRLNRQSEAQPVPSQPERGAHISGAHWPPVKPARLGSGPGAVPRARHSRGTPPHTGRIRRAHAAPPPCSVTHAPCYRPGPIRNRNRFGQARPRRLFAACRSARLQHGPAPLPRVPTFAASTFRAAPLPQRRDRPGGPPCSASARMCAAGDPPLKGRTSTGSRSAVHYVFLLHQEEAERPQHASNPPAPVYATLIRIRPAEAVPRPAPARRAVASSRRPLY